MNNLLVTPTYAPDFLRCKAMLESASRYISGATQHLILIDEPDWGLFKSLQSSNVQVVCKSEYLPTNLFRVPLQKRWWLTDCSWPVRGWILQQIIKLAVAAKSPVDSVSFVDSDVIFVRPFHLDHLWDAQQLRLFRNTRGPKQYRHIRYKNWYRFSCNALSIGKPEYQPSTFIVQLMSMRPELVRRLFRKLEDRFRRPWYQTLLNCFDFSEYTLYGLYAESLGEARSGHYFTESALCHSSWFYDIHTEQDVQSFVAKRSKKQCAIHLQSNLGLKPDSLVQALSN